ncbi:hypothetical protein FHG87_013021 [Trinorchestia longiramus]|nr:hypothetical protein FHG87_013021 [Trinorchestia longiramus]
MKERGRERERKREREREGERGRERCRPVQQRPLGLVWACGRVRKGSESETSMKRDSQIARVCPDYSPLPLLPSSPPPLLPSFPELLLIIEEDVAGSIIL